MRGRRSASTVSRMSGLGVGVAQRVDVGGVLGPDDEVRGGCPAGVDLPLGLEGRRDVVVEDLPALGVEVEPRPGHVALDAEELGGRPVGRQRHREPRDAQHERSGHEAGRPTPRHTHRGAGGGVAPPVRADRRQGVLGREREQGPAQRDDEGDEGGSAEGDEAPEGRVRLAEGQLEPREAAVGCTGPQTLRHDPDEREGERSDAPPAAQPAVERAGSADEERLAGSRGRSRAVRRRRCPTS